METPCPKCPWVSKDPRDIEITRTPKLRRCMKRTPEDFVCHLMGGPCVGAKQVSKNDSK